MKQLFSLNFTKLDDLYSYIRKGAPPYIITIVKVAKFSSIFKSLVRKNLSKNFRTAIKISCFIN